MPLEIILGCMYSGKSTELIRRVNRFKSIGMRCLVVNHSADTRVDGGFVQTHDRNRLQATKTDDICLVNTKGFDVIAIDEAQFFKNLRVAVNIMLKNKQVVVIAGLNGDYNRQKFGEIIDLIPMADNITFTKALCKLCCHPIKTASFTKRLDNDQDKVSVASEYISVCRQCYEK